MVKKTDEAEDDVQVKTPPAANLSAAEIKQRQEEAAERAEAEAAKLNKERAAAGWPTLGRIIIVKGFLVHATSSDEDPAIVNSATEKYTTLPNLSPVFKNGVLQVPVLPTLPEGALCFVNATMFPEGNAPRNIANIPFFKDREEALKYLPKDPVRSTNPNANLAAYWPVKY